MKNNKISKITMVASLLVAGIVNAQEFYTCVPKKDWWKNTIKESVKEQKKEEWKLIFKKPVIFFMEDVIDLVTSFMVGDYKVKLIKNNEIIAKQDMKVEGNEGSIHSCFWRCECGKEGLCNSPFII